MKTAVKLSLLALALVVFSTVSAQAQNNASINATASVQSPIVVTAGADLAFGNVFPGVVKTIAPASGGTFSVTGQASTPVTLQFTLPANLVSGGNTLPSFFRRSPSSEENSLDRAYCRARMRRFGVVWHPSIHGRM